MVGVRRSRTPRARRKRYGIDTAPWRDVVRARAAEHGLGARELAALVLGPARAPEIPDPRRVSGELAGAGGLTEKQNTFAKREAVMAWAAAHGQGAPAAAVERAAAEFLARDDVHRATGLTERRFTTSDLLAHEQAIVDGAQARRGEGTGRLDSCAGRRRCWRTRRTRRRPSRRMSFVA